MEPYMPDPDKYLPPVMSHAFGGNAKKLISALDTHTTFFTIEEALAPFPHPDNTKDPLLPMMLTTDGFTPCMGAHFSTPKLPFAPAPVYQDSWIKQHSAPQGCSRILASYAVVSPTWRPLERPKWHETLQLPTSRIPTVLPMLEVVCPGLYAAIELPVWPPLSPTFSPCQPGSTCLPVVSPLVFCCC